jgi:hypothetical protein
MAIERGQNKGKWMTGGCVGNTSLYMNLEKSNIEP